MRQTILASQFVDLGRHVQYLSSPLACMTTSYAQFAASFLSQLSSCDLPVTRNVAAPFDGMTIPDDGRTGRIADLAGRELMAMMKSVDAALKLETTAKQMICLDVQGVSSRLRALDSPALTPAQKLLLTETITCIECGAYHAATVMGWNLAFDCIRFWIFTNHLATFNAKLVANYQQRGGAPRYDPISTYDDFFLKSAPSERDVLDTAHDSEAFGGAIHDHLCQHLRQRNNSAHPTANVPTRDQTNAYIENLIDLITGPPFK